MSIALTGMLLVFCLWRGGLAFCLWQLDRRAAARGWPKDFAALNRYNALAPGAPNAAALIWEAGLASVNGDAHRDDQDSEANAEERNADLEASVAEAVALLEAGSSSEEAMNALLDSYTAPSDYIADRLPDDTPPLSDEWRKGIAQGLALHAPVLPLYEKAAVLGIAHFPIDFTRWPDSATELGDSWTSVKHGVALFQRQTILHADSGDMDKAVVAFGNSLQLLRTLETLPTAIAQLAWMSLVSNTLQTLRFMLSAGRQEKVHLQQIDGWLAVLQQHNPYDVAWAGERCILRRSFDIRDVRPEVDALETWEFEQELNADDDRDPDYPSEHSHRPASPKPGPGNWRLIYELPYKLAGLEHLDAILYMRAIETDYTLSTSARPARLAWLKVYNSMEQATSRWMLANARRITLDPSPILSSTVVTENRILAARMALSVEQYRIKHGSLPMSLSELPDTSDGVEATRYEVMEKGYAISYAGFDFDASDYFQIGR